MDLSLREAPAWQLVLLAAVGAIAAGGLVGRLLVTRGAVQTLALLLAIGVGAALLRSVWVAFAGVVAVAGGLPFATLPVGASVTPTLLEAALLVALVSGGAVLLIDRRQQIRTGGPQALALGLAGVVVAAFLLGLGRGYTTQTLHDFFKFLLAMATFWMVVQLVIDTRAARGLLWLLVAATSGAAALGLALYAAGPGLSERVLVRLVPYGYPGSRIVRYIEDDPARPMRAVGTSVDPNSFGGLLMIGFVLAAGQLLVRNRTIPAWLAGSAAAVCGLAMLLTYSRGAWVGAFAGLVVIVVLRRPWLLLPIGGLGVAAVALGLGAGFIERLWLGFTLQDPATKLRLDEYRNALAIIREHPWFGVGFGDAGSIELQAGVSSIYLTIAERAGLVGLACFMVVAGVIAWRGLRSSWKDDRSEDTDLTLCLTAAFVAALVVGLVDHYFFNPQFPHMAAIFWILAGGIAAIASPVGYARARHRVSSDITQERWTSRRRLRQGLATRNGG
ncbi:MAG TPA: O-antigen ligase family protein [Thermomicrobiales bacterium]|nr:O-antigen ligase family protein [Thermomicrobiales bacterium]